MRSCQETLNILYLVEREKLEIFVVERETLEIFVVEGESQSPTAARE